MKNINVNGLFFNQTTDILHGMQWCMVYSGVNLNLWELSILASKVSEKYKRQTFSNDGDCITYSVTLQKIQLTEFAGAFSHMYTVKPVQTTTSLRRPLI